MRAGCPAEIAAHLGTNSKKRTGRLRESNASTEIRRREPPAWLMILWNWWFHDAFSSGSDAVSNSWWIRRSDSNCSSVSEVAARLAARPAISPKIR